MRKIVIVITLLLTFIFIPLNLHPQYQQGHFRALGAFAFTPDGRYLISGDWGGIIKVWDLRTRRLVKTINAHNKSIRSMDVSNNGRFIVTASSDQTIRVFSRVTGKLVRVIRFIRGRRKEVNEVRVSNNGRYIVGAGSGGIKVYSFRTGRLIRMFKAPGRHRGRRYGFASTDISRDNRYIAGVRSKQLYIWDIRTGRVVKRLSAARYASCVRFSPDNKYLAVDNGYYGLALYSIKNNYKKIKDIYCSNNIIRFDFSPDGKYIAVGSNSYRGKLTVQLLDVEKRRLLPIKFNKVTGQVNDIKYSPDGKYVVNGTLKPVVFLWNVKNKNVSEINPIRLPVKTRKDRLNEKLFIAIKNKDFSDVKKLVKRGADVRAVNLYKKKSRQFTALITAIKSGDKRIIRYLINKGADVNRPSKYKNSPLHFAVKDNNVYAVRLLLKKGAKVNVQNNVMYSKSCTPLLSACKNGNLEIVKLLIRHGGSVHGKNSYNYTPIFVASENGHAKVVKYLLSKGAYVNGDRRNTNKILPVQIAAKKGHYDVVRALIRARANYRAFNYLGDDTLISAAIGGNLKIIKYLLRLRVPVDSRTYRRVRGADSSPKGITALMRAAAHGHLNVVKYLISRGAKVRLKSARGASPLLYAVSKNKYKAAEYLIKRGADVNVMDKFKNTALMTAVRHNYVESVRVLVKYRANLHISNKHNGTPLNFAKRMYGIYKRSSNRYTRKKAVKMKKIIEILENAGAK